MLELPHTHWLAPRSSPKETRARELESKAKDTSVVGFIAVQDLTRVGDLIRARTMEAFFPLIAIAIIYFTVCRLLAWLLGLQIKRLEPKDGPRTIKGVKLS